MGDAKTSPRGRDQAESTTECPSGGTGWQAVTHPRLRQRDNSTRNGRVVHRLASSSVDEAKSAVWNRRSTAVAATASGGVNTIAPKANATAHAFVETKPLKAMNTAERCGCYKSGSPAAGIGEDSREIAPRLCRSGLRDTNTAGRNGSRVNQSGFDFEVPGPVVQEPRPIPNEAPARSDTGNPHAISGRATPAAIAQTSTRISVKSRSNRCFRSCSTVGMGRRIPGAVTTSAINITRGPKTHHCVQSSRSEERATATRHPTRREAADQP